MSLRYYDIGDVAELTGTFTATATGAPIDPDEVVCTVRKPDGDTVTPTATGGAGVYTAEVAIDQAGDWWYAFDGDGGAQASGEKQFRVRERKVSRA